MPTPNIDFNPRVPSESVDVLTARQRFTETWRTFFGRIVKALPIVGYGDPENVVAASLGRLYCNLDGGAGTTLYVKEADDGLVTGWAAK